MHTGMLFKSGMYFLLNNLAVADLGRPSTGRAYAFFRAKRYTGKGKEAKMQLEHGRWNDKRQ